MKRWIAIGGLAGGTLLAAVVVLQGQTGTRPVSDHKKDIRTVTVVGSGTVKVKPDAARLTFAVQTLAAQVKLAREDNGKKVKKVTDAVNALKIPDFKMKTSHSTIELVYSRPDNETQLPEVIGYKVANLFTVRLSNADADKLGTQASQILDTALQNGANFTAPILLSNQNEAENRRQAFTKAVEDALGNARAMAAGAHVKILETVALDAATTPAVDTTQPYYEMANMYSILGRSPQGIDAPMQPPEQELTCRVTVTCSY